MELTKIVSKFLRNVNGKEKTLFTGRTRLQENPVLLYFEL